MGCNCDGDGSIQQLQSHQPVVKTGEPLKVSKEAASYIQGVMEKEKKVGWGIKLEVIPGGCAGYRYFMAFQEKPMEDEATLEYGGIKFFVSSESLEMLHGSEVNFYSGLEGSGLKIENPNATRTCGCGKSFG